MDKYQTKIFYKKFTKNYTIKKLRKIKNYKSVILENWEYLPEIFLTSSTKHIGKENILYYINKLNSDINQK